MASGDVFKLPDVPRTKIMKENIDTVRNLLEEKPNFSISLSTPTSNSLPELVNTAEGYATRFNKD